MSSGQPSVENGHSDDENHVSSTSGSCTMSVLWHCGHALGSSTHAMTFSQSRQVHTGIRWPHHIWREMHQSRTFSSQRRYSRSQRGGWKRSLPRRATSMAGAASSFILTNHWSDRRGSTTVPQR